MSLSNRVKTHVIDPRTHNSRRTEFRLEDAFWDSNWKLVDLGMYDSNQSGTTGLYYPTINGVLQTIETISLFSGTVMIDQMQNCQQYSSLEALKTSNQGSNDLNRQLLLNGMGWSTVGPGLSSAGALTLQQRYTENYVTLDGDQTVNNQVVLPGQADDQQSGQCMLRTYLKMLKTTTILPMIPNLRLLIEWNRTASDYFLDTDHSGGMSTPAPQPIMPRLVLDEVLGQDPASARSYVIPYLTTIVERFPVEVVTADNTDVPKKSSFMSQAFKNKFLKDVTLFKTPSSDLADSALWLSRKTRSVAQKGEVIQLIVNAETLLPYNGIDNEALSYHYFNEAQTQLNLPLLAGMENLRDASGNLINVDSAPFKGQFSVTSVKIGQIIQELRIQYQRLYGDTNASQQAFQLLVFGTVAQNLTVRDGVAKVTF